MRPVYVNGYSHASALGNDAGLAERAWHQLARSGQVTLPVEPVQTVGFFHFGADTRPLPSFMLDHALANSAIHPDDLRAGHCFIGSSSLGIGALEHDMAHTGQVKLTDGAGLNASAVDLASRCGISGPCITINTACTSSANALLVASRLIASGQIDHALVVGIETQNLTTLAGFHALQLLADEARPFDVTRQGIVLGEAISVVALACQPHPDYHARILGGANQGDTSSPTGTDEAGESIAWVIDQAIRRSGLTAQDIQLIKAQAGGSPANDRAEANGLHRVFKPLPTVTTLKSAIGHTLGASGCSELSLLLSCYRAGFSPATPGCRQPDPALGITPLREHLHAVPRYSLLNFFGFGGNNTAMVVEFLPG